MEFYREKIALRKRPEEKAILGKDTTLFSHKYGLHVLDGVSDMSPVVEAFWKTFHWSWHYFKMSEPLNWYWVYPYSDAPLLCDILKHSEHTKISKKKLNFNVNRQLQFIMPLSSLRLSKRRILYPDELHSETRNPWMKRHDWEMKPRISLPWNPEYCLTSVDPI
jgi:5'-3' exonuclease